MIRWLWARLVSWGWDYSYELTNPRDRFERDRLIEISDDEESGIDLPDPIRFKVQQVSGGTVVETRWYDHKKDENRIKLHIVTQEENLAEAIGKIVTMELLQK
jgi:hypothetical protein